MSEPEQETPEEQKARVQKMLRKRMIRDVVTLIVIVPLLYLLSLLIENKRISDAADFKRYMETSQVDPALAR